MRTPGGKSSINHDKVNNRSKIAHKNKDARNLLIHKTKVKKNAVDFFLNFDCVNETMRNNYIDIILIQLNSERNCSVPCVSQFLISHRHLQVFPT